MKAIYKRELKSYFNSMIGYIFIAFFVAFMGFYFMAYNLYNGYPYFSYTLSATITIMLIAVPILTMKSFAEDRKTKTDQLLLTAPVSVTQIVLGKYLAMVTVFLIPMLISCICPLIIKANGQAYLLTDYSTILAFFLMGCIFIAIGMFISALTESQIIAAVGTFGILFVLCLWSDLITFLPSSSGGTVAGILIFITALALIIWGMTKNWFMAAIVEAVGCAVFLLLYIIDDSIFQNGLSAILSRIDIRNAFNNFASNNIFDITGLIFYLSMSFIFVFLTVQVLLKRRWS
ncbi:MAG TPA: ABC-2 transporter permease [Candidatus Scybalocola faecipullorum]|nr:ABC-2 transporter permease [Candidatus Scybalocola faecipullorum]